MAPRRNTPRLTPVQRAEHRWGMALPPPVDPALERLRAAQRAEVAAGTRFDGQLTHGWFWRQLHTWTKRFDRLGKWAKALLTVLGAGGGLFGAGTKVWQYIEARRVAPAELPAQGEPTIATDHVEKPKPPAP